MILDVEFIEDVQDFDVEFGENIENTTELEAQIKTLNAQIAELQQDVTEAYEAGRKSKVKEHMDAITDNVNRKNCSYMFACFNDEAFKLEYPIQPTVAQYMFAWATITTPVL